MDPLWANQLLQQTSLQEEHNSQAYRSVLHLCGDKSDGRIILCLGQALDSLLSKNMQKRAVPR